MTRFVATGSAPLLAIAISCAAALASTPDSNPPDTPKAAAAAELPLAGVTTSDATRTSTESATPAEEALAGEPQDVIAAVKAYRDTGTAPVLEGAVLRYPYGHGQPTIQCLPLRACDIELQAGETITGVALGDSERWVTEPLLSGDPNSPTPHVILKPTESGIGTNLIIGTTRRTYHVSLSSPRSSKGQDTYVRRLSWYYPDELVAVWRGAAAAAAAAKTARTAVFTIPSDPTALNFDYRIKGDHAAWAPLRAFDDRAHLYIQFPDALRTADAPVLLAKTDKGELAIVNFRTSPDGHWYVADGTWPEAELVVGAGRSRTHVTITNRAYQK